MRGSIGPALASVWILVAACDHTAPVSDPPATSDRPFVPGDPARLTLNAGPDRSPAWLPDGSAIVYSAQQLGRTDNDVCLAVLP
ncbi:MAG: PD40 domain-containing protein [Gemmatimonadales bacterium]|nr:PD40 domain-containing protein [Gemmatimonadales bacterium]